MHLLVRLLPAFQVRINYKDLPRRNEALACRLTAGRNYHDRQRQEEVLVRRLPVLKVVVALRQISSTVEATAAAAAQRPSVQVGVRFGREAMDRSIKDIGRKRGRIGGGTTFVGGGCLFRVARSCDGGVLALHLSGWRNHSRGPTDRGAVRRVGAQRRGSGSGRFGTITPDNASTPFAEADCDATADRTRQDAPRDRYPRP